MIPPTPSGISRRNGVAISFVPGVLVIVLWHVAISLRPELSFWIGSPVRVGMYLVDGVRGGWLLRDALITGSEAAVGFVIGNGLGVLAGIALWWLPLVEKSLRPYVAALGSAPLFAASPLLILWFGTGYFGKVATAALSTVFVALAHAGRGIRSVPIDHVRLVTAFGGTRREQFVFAALPAMLSWTVAAMRLNVGFAILGAFLGEFLAAEAGLGKRIIVATGLFDMSLVLAGIIALVGVAGGMYAAILMFDRWLRRRLRE